MSPRIFLVGESNPYGSNPDFALYPLPAHATGGRLAKVLNLTADEYLARFERHNLLVGPRWSVPEARRGAVALLRELDHCDQELGRFANWCQARARRAAGEMSSDEFAVVERKLYPKGLDGQ